MTPPANTNETGALVKLIAIVAIGVFAMLGFVALTLRPSGPGTAAEAMTAQAEAYATDPAPVAAVDRPMPQWIWSGTEAQDLEAVTFRRRVDLDGPADRLTLTISCDNTATVFVDGVVTLTTGAWSEPAEIDLAPRVSAPDEGFDLEIRAKNAGGPAGLLAVVTIETGGRTRHVVSDGTWTMVDPDAPDTTKPVVVLGAHGMAPWGTLPGFVVGDLDRGIEAPPGFIVELVHAVSRSHGSWVALAVDDAGRLIASDQGDKGMFRITPAPIGEDASGTVVEPIAGPVSGAQGLLCVEGDLYAVVAGNQADGPGLYRLRDTDDDDAYDASERLWSLTTGGEHGPHGIVLGPDGMLYVTAGNHTKLPEIDTSTVPRHWGEDQLLPRLWDAKGHAVGMLAPGGWICRMDRDGRNRELIAIGFRNTYDIAFDDRGELFTFDADMEWDIGAPWYRPTRINHVVSGVDFGWRSGTGKWLASSPDSLPATIDIGPGSPTGVCFGHGAAFPSRYQEALYALDWTFGTIYAVHLEPDGATYRATCEPFVTGRPLPVADAVVNPHDGAMYFLVGGRGVPSAIYRVRNEYEIVPGRPVDDVPRDFALRRTLEKLHTPDAPDSAIETIWPHLGSGDPFIAHAARTALEFRPPARWRGRLHREAEPRTALVGLLALARAGGPPDRDVICERLLDMDWADLDPRERTLWLRTWTVTLARWGAPEARVSRQARLRLERLYPSEDALHDRALCDLLVFLESPVVVARTIALMERADTGAPEIDEALLRRNDTYGSVILKAAAAHPQQQQVHYALALRTAQRGWSDDLRARYFRWFDSARAMAGGHSFTGFLDRIRDDALDTLDADERARYARTDDGLPDDLPRPEGPGRQWTTAEVVDLARDGLAGRDLARGARMYRAASCDQCHRFAGTGQAGGPDLTAVATRFSVRDLVEAIVEPSRVISDQYELTELVLDDDSIVLGRVVSRDRNGVRVMPSFLVPDAHVTVDPARILSEQASMTSPMPAHLINGMNDDEVRDLLAYLLAGQSAQ